MKFPLAIVPVIEPANYHILSLFSKSCIYLKSMGTYFILFDIWGLD